MSGNSEETAADAAAASQATLACRYGKNAPRVFVLSTDVTVLGRGRGVVDIDLSPDQNVSRKHAQITFSEGSYWLEDLGSSHGTSIDGSPVGEKVMLTPGTTFRIGGTELRFDIGAEDQRAEPADELPDDDGDVVTAVAAADAGAVLLLNAVPAADAPLQAAQRRLTSLYEIGAALATTSSADELLRLMLTHLSQAIPDAERVGLLLKESGRLVPKAFLPRERKPSYSLSLATRAMDMRSGLIWRRHLAADDPAHGSVVRHGTQSAVYAPLVWKGEAFGVVYLDNGVRPSAFDGDDLRLTIAIANQAAIFVQNNALQRKIGQDEQILNTLLRPFPPKVAERLLRSRGRLRPGGEWAECATVLFSDVRGFTALSARTNPDDVMQLLNDMFYEFVPIIRRHDGTVDKYAGDAVLAIFGSPEPDDNQWEKAVRAAVAMQEAVSTLADRWQQRGLPALRIGIGIHSGELIHGFIGSPERMEYSVVGDTVNKGSRYCDGADAGEIAISPAVYQHVDRIVRTAPQIKIIRSKHPDTEPDMEAYIVAGLEEHA